MAVMKELSPLLHRDGLTVSGRILQDSLDEAGIKDTRVIREFDHPYSRVGGLTILYGNLAPEGAVIKSSAVADGKRLHRGPARVFDLKRPPLKPS